ncbi:hypothetical protein ACFLX8_03415 [Chloroflexota bacterium]
MDTKLPDLELLSKLAEAHPEVETAIRTLTMGGFTLVNANRMPYCLLIQTTRRDEFGSVQNYSFALVDHNLTSEQVDNIKIPTRDFNSTLVIIGTSETDDPQIEWNRFINIFGGGVYSSSPLDPDFKNQLNQLGHMQLPEGLIGKADDLFEIFAHSALQFLLGGKVIRYGQARLFESKPDGLMIPNSSFTSLYDAKAAKDGYNVISDSIRQFKTYVDDHIQRYSHILGRLYSFVVVSGHFQQMSDTLARRSQELISTCGIPLCFLSVDALVQMLDIVLNNIKKRNAVNWSKVFTEPVANPKTLQEEIGFITKDEIVK